MLTRAKAAYAEASRQYGKLTGIWQNPASAREWALNVDTKQNASSKATELANLLVATPAERARFVEAFTADPFDALKQFVANAKQEVERALTPAWRDYAQTPAGLKLLQGYDEHHRARY